MSRIERSVRSAALLAALGIAIASYQGAPDAHAQQLGEGMVRSGTVGIQNDGERKLFYSLLCTCGCPRETLGTCTCGFAHARRGELRAQLDEGLAIDVIQAEYVKKFGTQALAVPPNSGSNRALYLLPLAAAVVGGAGIFFSLRRWRRRNKEQDRAATKADAADALGRDAYDDKLDDELKDLDKE